MRIHLIAIGGAIMHNLAIALKRKGYHVTGSDDAIYDPAKSNLNENDLLPEIGWNEDLITADIDVIILGMHARKNNPELVKAQKLGLKIMSFPEFVAAESKNKKRVVISGSHGKTTTTAMIMYVLSRLNLDFDYLVGSSINGFDLSVKISDAPLIIIEGDEYLSSSLDLKSKFLWYNPHISIITGIAYDHINVFPTFESYLDTFEKYMNSHVSNGQFLWYKNDEHLQKLTQEITTSNNAYDTPKYRNTSTGSEIFHDGLWYPLMIVGKHNLENLYAAQLVCVELGVTGREFYKAVSDFTGAGRRMEKIYDKNDQVIYRDFAHSPSKLKATINAVKESFEGTLLAVFELHTFSSLTKVFIPLYENAMDAADRAIVFYNDAVFENKKMEYLDSSFVQNCFGDVSIINSKEELEKLVNSSFENGENILLMSSGTFQKASFLFD
ncbi:MAG: Mur ligase family protein [Bacteroidia bacterium]|nr:Mur ligase family protein [Bacteroidia bacterium]